MQWYLMSSHRRVYVGNIPYACSKAELTKHMERVGEISRIHILTNEIGHPRGKAIIEYVTAEAVDRAVQELNKSLLEGRALIVKADEICSRKKSASPRPSLSGIVSFNNLPLSVTPQQLKDVCRQAGPVQGCEVPLDHSGRSKGQGVVAFERYEDALQAVRLFNGAVFNDRRVSAVLQS